MKKVIFISSFVLFFSIFSVFSFAYSQSVRAQTIGTTSLDGIDITSSPSNPTPGSNVTVTLESYSTNLSGATIAWSVNGKSMAQGRGLESITVVAPATGKSLQVMATIDTLEGANIQKLISITSGSVDLIWETSGYVPPLYQGKIPFVYQNTLNIIAMPNLVDSNGKPIDPKNLIYQWTENTFALGSQSGYGKQSLVLTGFVIPQTLDIDVTVTSIDGSAHAENQIAIAPTSPGIIFYQDDPLYGILYNEAIGDTLNLIHNQTKIVAVPYGFDLSASGVQYTWNIDGTTQSNLSSSRTAVLGVSSGQQGNSVIDLSIQNVAKNILQGAEASFTAIASGKTTSNATTTTNVIF